MTKLEIRGPKTSAVGFSRKGHELATTRELRRGLKRRSVKLTPRIKWTVPLLAIGAVTGPASWWWLGEFGLVFFFFAWGTIFALAAWGHPPGDVTETSWHTDRVVVLDLLEGEVREEEGMRTLVRIPLDEQARVIVRDVTMETRVVELHGAQDKLELATYDTSDVPAVAQVQQVLDEVARYGVSVPAPETLTERGPL